MSLALKDTRQALRVPPILQFAAAALIVAAVSWGVYPNRPVTAHTGPQTVSVLPGSVSYRASGEFQLNGMPVDGQLQPVTLPAPVEIMKYQVSEKQYGECVADGGCEALDHPFNPGGKLPVTGVSFRDAEKYSFWLSGKTGDIWRLPTDQEWASLAGSKYADDAVGRGSDPVDPSRRWLDQYEFESSNAGLPDPDIHPAGFFGSNENGIIDLSGNVWEWTSTCYARSTLSADGSVISAVGNCGVRIVEGRHRAYMTDFVRDAKSGGCAVGAPPDHLGMRLVREEPGFLSWRRLRGFFLR